MSTHRQAEDGDSLDVQCEKMRHLKAEGWNVLGIYEDEASAFKAGNHERRSGLQDVVKKCLEEGVPLVVMRIDRLSRDLSILDLPGFDRLEVWSIDEGGFVGGRELQRRIERASRGVETRSREAAAAMQRKKAKGAKFGNRKNLVEARRRGVISNMCRADEKAERLLELLEAHPDLANLSWPQKAAALNELGSRNRTRKDDLVGKPWTKDTLRKSWAKAVALSDELEQMGEDGAEELLESEHPADEAAQGDVPSCCSVNVPATSIFPVGASRVDEAPSQMLRESSPRSPRISIMVRRESPQTLVPASPARPRLNAPVPRNRRSAPARPSGDGGSIDRCPCRCRQKPIHPLPDQPLPRRHELWQPFRLPEISVSGDQVLGEEGVEG